MTTALAGHDLVLGYPRTTVVHGVSVDIRPGVVTALVGPNGSGKSTVLRSLARLHPVSSGSVELDGSDSAPLSARAFARRVTLLSQSRPHPSGVTVHDVVTWSPPAPPSLRRAGRGRPAQHRARHGADRHHADGRPPGRPALGR
ncbi:ABC transporter ATP-binding protein [Nocardioides daphniae]|uniref:ATP-binding cassette domain-containing protein n=1 Tax=Nocardioides daphniae TaxID=402297 RepID=UPI0023AEE86F|nr:ABC transporter ATP-binding protein [Nocardioides daphniae]